MEDGTFSTCHITQHVISLTSYFLPSFVSVVCTCVACLIDQKRYMYIDLMNSLLNAPGIHKSECTVQIQCFNKLGSFSFVTAVSKHLVHDVPLFLSDSSIVIGTGTLY